MSQEYIWTFETKYGFSHNQKITKFKVKASSYSQAMDKKEKMHNLIKPSGVSPASFTNLVEISEIF